jgi:hypothetical protein
MKPLAILITLAMLASCSPHVRVYSDCDPDFDLWTYKTFDWAGATNIEAGKNPLYYNELNDKRIKTAIKNELTNRGYQLVDEQPGLIVHYHIVVTEGTLVSPESYGYTYGPYWTNALANLSPYREGTLIVDLMDSQTKNLVWRGWAVSAINDDYKPKQVDELIKKAVAKMFNRFPVRLNSTEKIKNVVSNE